MVMPDEPTTQAVRKAVFGESAEALALVTGLLRCTDTEVLKKALEACELGDTIQPMVNPTEYINGGRERLRHNTAIIKALLVCVEAIQAADKEVGDAATG